MSVFESIIYGLVSGFAEFLPVSSQGHQAIMFSVFGLDHREPFRDFIVHIAVLIVLMITCRPLFSHLRREQIIATRRRGRKAPEHTGLYDLRLIKTAGFPLIVGLLFYFVTGKYEFSLLPLVMFFVVNGIILIIPEYIRHGNKDARFLTGLDGILLGLFGAASVIPGISRVAAMHAYGIARGTDRSHVMNWILVLTVPVLVVYMGFDIFNMFAIGLGITGFIYILSCLLSGIMAFIGGYFGIMLVRFLTVRAGFAGFAYYSWGAALFTFILYLIV